MSAQSAPNRVDARTIRRALRAKFVEVAVAGIASTEHATYIDLAVEEPLLAATPDAAIKAGRTAEAVAAAIRPLWHDHDTRVHTIGRVTIIVDRRGWEQTHPTDDVEPLHYLGDTGARCGGDVPATRTTSDRYKVTCAMCHAGVDANAIAERKTAAV